MKETEKEIDSENLDKEESDSERTTFIKRIKNNEAITPTRMIVIASTTATTAFISSKLTNFLNTTILFALIAVFTGFVTEFYSHFYSLTGKGIKRIVPKNERIKTLQKERQELRTNKKTAVKGPDRESSKFVKFFEQYSISLFILLIAALTLGSVTAINYFTEKPVVNQITQVQQPVEKMSTQEKEELIDAATENAKGDLNKILHYLQNTTSDNIDNISEVEDKISSINSLINSLSESNKTLEKNISDMVETDSLKDETIKELEKKLTGLSEDYEKFKDEVNSKIEDHAGDNNSSNSPSNQESTQESPAPTSEVTTNTAPETSTN